MSAPETEDVNLHRVKNCQLLKRINDDKDVALFRSQSPAYRNISNYVEALCELIKGTGHKIFNHKYQIKTDVFKKCAEFLDKLEVCCNEIDLNQSTSRATNRFGHVAFRDWSDMMAKLSESFIYEQLAPEQDSQLKGELYTYLIESFGNKMRIDYGTGHELNFVIFSMGLIYLVGSSSSLNETVICKETLKKYVSEHGWDIIALFARNYLRLCRRLQTKFRLEPAGSRGVYNMDDFQFLPFLLGAAQLVGIKYASCKQFYEIDQVDMYKSDYIFFEAVDFILINKRGPFNEHSYTLWGFTNLNSWEIIFNRIKYKFTEDILGPFPIVQHLLFGKYILNWSPQEKTQSI